jgi:hypothetical protein
MGMNLEGDFFMSLLLRQRKAVYTKGISNFGVPLGLNPYS